MKKVKGACLILFALMLLGSCGSKVKVPNTEVCTVAGVVAAGGNCAMTLTGKTREMTLDEFLEFLEPQEESVDSASGKVIPARGGALCQSAADYNRQKTALELACIELGKKCSYEMKQLIRSISFNIKKLQDQTLK